SSFEQELTSMSSTNDILSLKKEIVGIAHLPAVAPQPINRSHPQARGSIGSIVPLEYVQLRNAQSAVDKTALLLTKTIDAFEKTAQQLLQRSLERLSREQARDVGDFVRSCQLNCTANLAWRYSHPWKLAKLALIIAKNLVSLLVDTESTDTTWPKESVSRYDLLQPRHPAARCVPTSYCLSQSTAKKCQSTYNYIQYPVFEAT
ncbi:MAG: hypothetical protein L6R42_005852, partial [Xanthoria sp. 1 TBL-2021]